MPRTISKGENVITNPYDTANILNNYFSSVSDTVKESIKYYHKHFSDYLNNQCNNFIFIQPTDSEEIVISYLLSTSSSNSIPYKILNLLKKDISKQFADLLNFSLSSGFFSSLLKTAKVVVPFYKKDPKLDCYNHSPISLV